MKKFFSLLIFLSLLISKNSFAGDLPKLHGFAESAFGLKVNDDKKASHNGYNMLEQRINMKFRYFPDEFTFLEDWNTEIYYNADVLFDEYRNMYNWQPRQIYTAFTPLDFVDLKIGAQILTWGTGDYLFLNDTFPKDYDSFLIGRDDDYLKLPSYAARATFFIKDISWDIIAIPFFTGNRVPEGRRLSFYDPFQGKISGTDVYRKKIEPPYQFENTEWASRVYSTIGSFEWALYYSRGFYKNPNGYKNEAEKEIYHPRLSTYGASLRGPVPWIDGIGNLEIAYYDSLEDKAGKIRTRPNSTIRYLVGYKKAFKDDLEIGLQYFADQMLYYDNYTENLMPPDRKEDGLYQLLTLRITKLFADQTIRASFFAFYSPTDSDAYLRPVVTWDATDQWKLTLGGNIFFGLDTGDWGQFKGDSNIYMRLRYSF
ncbi:MAG: hypothetical protein PHQ52_03790 [Candidatus Omnitrophica bacterium]|nr:hypothetical protein [Candidatus Omnitrophota bacterium]